jgi:ribosomal small subunit protein bTHX
LASLKEFINFVGQSYNYLIINIMGKGDKKTKRGKILMGSHGVRRARKKAIRTLPVKTLKDEIPGKNPKDRTPVKPNTEIEEVRLEAPKMETSVEETVKPARKKAPPKSSKKEEKDKE